MTDGKSSQPIWVALREDGGPKKHPNNYAREPEDTDWACGVTWTVNAAGALPTGVELRAPLGEAVGPQRWRWVRLAEVISYSRDVVTADGHLGLGLDYKYALAVAASKRTAKHKKGVLPQEHFEWIAAVYNNAVRLGDPNPVKNVWAEAKRTMGDDAATHAAVRGWIAQAKKRRLITQTARPSRSATRRGEPT